MVFLKTREAARRQGQEELNDSESQEEESSESDEDSDSLFDELEDEENEDKPSEGHTLREESWTEIASLVEFRTPASIKYHWKSAMQRKLPSMSFGLGTYLERTASQTH